MGAPSGSVERSWATLDLDHTQTTGGSIRPVLLRYCTLRAPLLTYSVAFLIRSRDVLETLSTPPLVPVIRLSSRPLTTLSNAPSLTIHPEPSNGMPLGQEHRHHSGARLVRASLLTTAPLGGPLTPQDASGGVVCEGWVLKKRRKRMQGMSIDRVTSSLKYSS